MNDPEEKRGKGLSSSGVPARVLEPEPLTKKETRMMTRLVAQGGWCEDWPADARKLMSDKLWGALRKAKSSRDITRLARALRQLEQNDLARDEAEFGRADSDRRYERGGLTFVQQNIQNNQTNVNLGNRRELPKDLTRDDLRALAKLPAHAETTATTSPTKADTSPSNEGSSPSDARRDDSNTRQGRQL